MKPRVIIKGIINYIFAMVFAGIFALFLNANVGWFILLALIMAPILSVFFAWLSSRMLEAECEMEEALLSKGDKCNMTIRIHNASLFPTPPIDIALTNEPGIRSKEPNILVSVISRAGKSLEVDFQARLCGPWNVGIDTIRVTDYLGLFSFPIKRADYTTLKKRVAVIPDIAEISAKDDNIMRAMQLSLHADDSEETVESQLNTFGGFPGYDSRDYVPGDPLKRINWKQSAKRNRLLVRLDEELASQSIGLVLDSVFKQDEIDVHSFTSMPQYRDCPGDEIAPRIAEDAVENALGIMQVLVRRDYTVNFYVRMQEEFLRYDIEDEKDLENISLELAYYSFSRNAGISRFPKEEVLKNGSGAFLFSTPNSCDEASRALEAAGDTLYTTIYSAVDESKKQFASGDFYSWGDVNTDKRSTERGNTLQSTRAGMTMKVEPAWKEKVLTAVKTSIVPYLLALLLSTSMFAVFEIPFLSHWTLWQALTGVGIFALCEYVRKHKIIGGMLVTILVMTLLSSAARIVFTRDYGLDYMHWFMSGGESVATTSKYLLTLLMVFTTFFALVCFYFVKVLYRTSFLMLVSLLPSVTYVKVMQDIDMTPVVLITVLNIAAFLLNNRTRRDKGKRIVGQVSGLVSLGIYLLILVLVGLAAPKEEDAKYYYIFESLFLGGNVSEELPEEYSTMSEYSGNADGFNELNNRKLYEISASDVSSTLYLKRQNFDLYDFENNRWYSSGVFSTPSIAVEDWAEERRFASISHLSEALKCVEEYEPGFLAKYHMERAVNDYESETKLLYVTTTNFPSEAYIIPENTLQLEVINNTNDDRSWTYITQNGEFQRLSGFLHRDLTYNISYYDEELARSKWISLGCSNMDSAASLEMFEEMIEILEQHQEEEHLWTAQLHKSMLLQAIAYNDICAENTALIPESVRELALEITRDCTYDWEKAQALVQYFKDNDFVYDLDYRAPNDSVEYFLFKGKIGTCSDYASAFTLMARSAGLTVRYAEGFVPKQEYTGQYIVRTDCGHAYPEVYIQNVGYVVYESTNPARYADGNNQSGGFFSYFMTAGFRLLLIITIICAVILFLLFLHMIVAPLCREAYFIQKLRKIAPSQAIVLMYKRLRDVHFVNNIPNARVCTPYEYAEAFEKRVNFDISRLIYLLEQGSYSPASLTNGDKQQTEEIYRDAKAAIKEMRRKERKEKYSRMKGRKND